MYFKLINPFNRLNFETERNTSLNQNFKKLSKSHKALTIIASATVTLLTLGIGTYFYVKRLVGRLKEYQNQGEIILVKINRASSSIREGNSSQEIINDEVNELDVLPISSITVEPFPSDLVAASYVATESTFIANPTINLSEDELNQQFERRLEKNSQTFLQYTEKCEREGVSVDLVMARGKSVNQDPCCPQLLPTRFSLQKGEHVPYSPLYADLNPEYDPDVQVNVTSQDMECFPPNSFDDIFIENIYPSETQTNLHTYSNIARILKEGGTFVMDANCLCYFHEMEEMKKRFTFLFDLFRIPLKVLDYPSRRNTEHDDRILRFCFQKTHEFDLNSQKFINKGLWPHIQLYFDKINTQDFYTQLPGIYHRRWLVYKKNH